MIPRNSIISRLLTAIQRSPITGLLGPRQCGKTTLARSLNSGMNITYFDLESAPDQQRLQNPELVLRSINGLVILDEIQFKPELFSVLRVLVDQPENKTKFLILGSASPSLIKHASETLAGRIEFVELAGFTLSEVGQEYLLTLWNRGGFPRSYLSNSDEDSFAWRDGFIRTYLERDIPQMGISIPAAAMRRFWMMLSFYHGQTWNASEISRSMGLSDKTVRSYLDILTGLYMVRQLQPWHENIRKRQVKAPKIYLRDTGILHNLLNLPDLFSLYGHPKVGASWEGYAIEQILLQIKPVEAYYWGTYNDAELDLLIPHNGKRYGFEMKFNEAPKLTASMFSSIKELQLDHLWIIYPGEKAYPVQEKITVCPLRDIPALQINSIGIS
jgi:uncharacterized protein